MISPLPLLPERDDLAPDLQRAAHYIDAHLDDSLTIGEVAAAAGVAGRTLHKHFHDVFDIIAAELEPKPSSLSYDRFLA